MNLRVGDIVGLGAQRVVRNHDGLGLEDHGSKNGEEGSHSIQDKGQGPVERVAKR